MSLTIMYRVLSAMFLPGLQLSWFLLNRHVHRPGPESTMATSQLNVTYVFYDRHTHSLTIVQIKFQDLAEMIQVHISTIPSPIAAASHVHHMNTAAYAHVLSAQNDH